MFQPWRLKIREAEEAFDQGRLDEAQELISEGDLQRYLPGKRLTAKIAGRLARRAEYQIELGNSSAGWRDLARAENLAGETDSLLSAKGSLIAAALAETEILLKADDLPCALEKIERLEQRGAGGQRLQMLKKTIRHIQSAKQLSRRGKFSAAEQQLAAAFLLRGDLSLIEERRSICHDMISKDRKLTEKMRNALEQQNWNTVLSLADELLRIAPDHRLAREARRKAWSFVGACIDDSGYFGRGKGIKPPIEIGSQQNNYPSNRINEVGIVAVSQNSPRLLLWVDAVGGFLVCLGDEIVLGQAAPGGQPDVPILADLSRQHAKIRRIEGGYVIEPRREVKVEGKLIEATTLLTDGDEIALGESVLLRFRKPHALSATARLDFISRHNTQPTSDGVLLMAESCVMGPNWNNHIVCRNWSSDVVLYRQDDELYCRALDSIEIDGMLCEGKGRISENSRVVGNDFSMTLESL